ncbi:hypothetical protein KOI35_23070 [Actinoplanes bogorensis]|uniref:CYTH domain-containing protein n=1 Tax=Paractinoplanes bogorensis TaxID=1610840 RepID=A0ABS5YW99_9ACTN|nr:hypothetical protein [Actinoplanes bogorensis]MBU2666390.1 hypothetical protein [Actinoplanes bogorensis]
MTEAVMTTCFWQPPEIGKVPKVELKVAVSPADLATLGADLRNGVSRTVYFLDTPGLALRKRGLIVRVRSTKGRPGDAVVKLRRPVLPKTPGWLRRDDDFAVEIDALPDNYACSGALKRTLGRSEVDRTVASGKSLTRLLSAQQRRLLTAYGKTPLTALQVFGPVEVRRCRLTLAALDHPLVAERWRFPDGSVIAELSTRCSSSRVFEVADETSSALRAYGIMPDDEPQVTKTEATLRFFAPRLEAEAA